MRRIAIAVVIAGLVGTISISAATARNSHEAKPKVDHGYWTSGNKGTWVYRASCQCWDYHDMRGVWDSTGSAYNPGKGTLNLSTPIAVEAMGPITGFSVQVLGRQTILKAASVYSLSRDGKTAKLLQSLQAPRGADEVTISASGGPTSGVQVIRFGKNGRARGPASTVPLSAFVDVALFGPLRSCSDGFRSPPVIQVPLDGNSGGVAGFPIAAPCHPRWHSRIVIEGGKLRR